MHKKFLYLLIIILSAMYISAGIEKTNKVKIDLPEEFKAAKVGDTLIILELSNNNKNIVLGFNTKP